MVTSSRLLRFHVRKTINSAVLSAFVMTQHVVQNHSIFSPRDFHAVTPEDGLVSPMQHLSPTTLKFLA
eukprot:1668160-Amphidinium_carterae.2